MNKLIKLTISLVVLLTLVTGCANTQKETINKDREGNDIVLPEKIERILSTAPSNTEILVELGVADKIIGVDKYSTNVEGLNSEVEVIDFRNPDSEAIIEMKPDIIIASGHNKTSEQDPYALLKEAGITVVYIPTSNSIQGIKDDITFLGAVVSKEDKANEMNLNIDKEVNEIKEKAKQITNKKKVLIEVSGDPIVSVGNDTFLHEFIEIIGATNIMGTEKGWPYPSVESILELNPDVIITTESWNDKALETIKSRPGFDIVNAVKNDQVYIIDADLSSRCSHKSIEALKLMAKMIYPEIYGE